MTEGEPRRPAIRVISGWGLATLALFLICPPECIGEKHGSSDPDSEATISYEPTVERFTQEAELEALNGMDLKYARQFDEHYDASSIALLDQYGIPPEVANQEKYSGSSAQEVIDSELPDPTQVPSELELQLFQPTFGQEIETELILHHFGIDGKEQMCYDPSIIEAQ